MESSPFYSLSESIKNNRPIIIFLRNNRKLIGYLRAYDRHMNLILENVKEIQSKETSAKIKNFNERYFSKLVLRGDSVVIILPF
jgi:small nuclear ribonucleoprotein D2